MGWQTPRHGDSHSRHRVRAWPGRCDLFGARWRRLGGRTAAGPGIAPGALTIATTRRTHRGRRCKRPGRTRSRRLIGTTDWPSFGRVSKPANRPMGSKATGPFFIQARLRPAVALPEGNPRSRRIPRRTLLPPWISARLTIAAGVERFTGVELASRGQKAARIVSSPERHAMRRLGSQRCRIKKGGRHERHTPSYRGSGRRPHQGWRLRP
jgi:hypothetical protein